MMYSRPRLGVALACLAVVSSVGAQDCPSCYPPDLPYPGWTQWDPKVKEPFRTGTFPPGFMFGAAVAAFQTEGAFNEGGKSEGVWDKWCHNNTRNPSTGNYKCGHKLQQNGDNADKSYEKYAEDIQLLKDLGVGYYRFSLAWTRIMPNGMSGGVNMEAVDHYQKVFKLLNESNIEPVVTLFHWNLPQSLEEKGGWTNEGIIPEFVAYAQACFQHFGMYSGFWTTFNEPWTFIYLGYTVGEWAMAPGNDRDPYVSAFMVLRSHARTYRLMHKMRMEGKVREDAKMSINLNSDWVEPAPGSGDEGIKASYRGLSWNLGWFAEPIYGSGDWPVVMRILVEKAYGGAYTMPTFPAADSPKGTFDYFALNHYSTNYGYPKERQDIKGGCTRQVPNYCKDMQVGKFKNCPQANMPPSSRQLPENSPDCWPYAQSSWLTVNPWGIRRMLRYIKATYPEGVKKGIVITENGVDMPSENAFRGATALYDPFRINFLSEYLNQVMTAIHEDGVNVVGYMVWSLLDNFEWADAYTKRFGLYRVDYTDYSRTPKQSACAYSSIVKGQGFPKGRPAMPSLSSPGATQTCSHWASAVRKANANAVGEQE